MTDLLTARAVAGTLGVSTETILRWTRRGELPAIRLPSGALRYRAAALDAWLGAREIRTAVAPVNDVSRADETRLTNNLAVQGHDRL